MQHPQSHLWPALQRRFADQNRSSTAPDRLLRGMAIAPLDGQEESSVYTLGFREVASTLRTPSLSRDFQSLAAMISPAQPCYIAAYVGDAMLDGMSSANTKAGWVLIAYVPSECSSFQAKQMADNRAGLKAGLGAEHFGDGGMWAVVPEQISLSHYMRSTDAKQASAASPAAGLDIEGAEGGAPDAASALPSPAKRAREAEALAQQAAAASKIQGAMRRSSSRHGFGVGDEALWQERVAGVRHAYVDSCARLVGALADLEQTLCGLTGESYPGPDGEPLLRARAHLTKNLELLR